MATPREELARLLGGVETTSSDSATVLMPADVLQLQVSGVGRISVPVRAADAKKLASVARPAHFGRGAQTLHDASVRDTWEITPGQITLVGDVWQESLRVALEHLGAALGIPDPTRLRAELHALLVYGKDQFFAAHQDSEKHDDMLATLVLTLPSNHTGGQLVVHGRDGAKEYPGSRRDLTAVAFYADRRHEVLPVRSGHRISLTFNVLLEGAPPTEVVGPVDRAAALLRAHLSTPVKRRYSDVSDIPARLAFLLDHEYSQRGLTVARLKGEDARQAAVLTAAAEAAGCEWTLAQVEIQETWDAMASDPYYEGRGHYYDYDEGDADGEEDEADPDAYELGDLIDSTVVLTWWADPGDVGEINLSLGAEEVCAATPSEDLTPYASEHEGYMGNYGNTMDRWYRRAALVVWLREKGFAARAEASPGWALGKIRGSLSTGEVERAREEVQALIEVWGRPPQALLSPALEVAAGVRDAGLAAELLAPFGVELLEEGHATALAELARQHPGSWWVSLRERWDRRRGYGFGERRVWVEATLVRLCRHLQSVGATAVAGWLASWMGEWLLEEIASHLGSAHAAYREEQLGLHGPVLAAVLAVADEKHCAELVDELRSEGDLVLPLLLSAVRSHEPPAGAVVVSLAAHVHERLTDLLAQPPRSADDWSLAWTSPGGEDEDRLEAFLRSATERRMEWPLAKPRRQRIHQLIAESGLPVRHATRRTGRPYTLVLTKTDEIFVREKAARARAEEDLARLQTVVQASPDGRHPAPDLET